MSSANPRKAAAARRTRKNVPTGVVHIQATFNNTIVTISDPNGNTVSWLSVGVMGFKGSRKSTPFVVQLVAEDVARKAMEYGMKAVGVFVKGPGSGRESALRAIANSRLKITHIRDLTPIPHNGCRPPKRRQNGRASCMERVYI